MFIQFSLEGPPPSMWHSVAGPQAEGQWMEFGPFRETSDCVDISEMKKPQRWEPQNLYEISLIPEFREASRWEQHEDSKRG